MSSSSSTQNNIDVEDQTNNDKNDSNDDSEWDIYKDLNDDDDRPRNTQKYIDNDNVPTDDDIDPNVYNVNDDVHDNEYNNNNNNNNNSNNNNNNTINMDAAPSSPTPNMAPPKHPPPTPMKPLRRKRRTSARLGVRGRGGEREREGDDDLENDDLENDDLENESEDEVYFNAATSGAPQNNTSNKKKPVPTRRKLEDAFDRIAEKRGGKGKLLSRAFDDFEEEYEREEKNNAD